MSSKQPSSACRILIAEDESLIALELEQIVRELGCDVIGPVSRVEDILEKLETEKCDGALLDVNLRSEQVFPILPRLQERGIPFIITSGYDAISLFPREYRDLPRLAKPFDENALKRLCQATFSLE